MAMKRLRIEIAGDNTPWNKAIAASIAAANKLNQTQQQNANQQRQRTKNEAAEMERAWKKANSEVLKDFQARQAAQSRAAAQSMKQDRDSVASWKRANNEMLADFNARQAAQSRAERQAAKEQRDSERAWKRANKEMLADFQARTKAQEELTKSTQAEGNAIANVIAGLASMATAMTVVNAAIGMWEHWNRATADEVKQLAGVREQLLELAALKGRLGDTTTENAAQLQFRGQTLQNKESAIAFQGQFLNTAQANIDAGLISKEEANKFMVQAGRFQAAEGGSATTHGGLAGSLPSMLGAKPGGGKWTAAELQQHGQRIFNQQQAGSFTFTQGADQLLALQGLLGTGAFGKGPEALHSLVGTHAAISSMTSPARAEDLTRQLVGATSGSVDRLRNPKLRQGPDDEKLAEYFERIGVKPGMTQDQINKLLLKDFAEQEKKGGKLEGKTLLSYMQHRGMMNEGAINALGALKKAGETGVYAQHMERAQTATGLSLADTNDPNRISYEERLRRFNFSPTANNRRTEIGELGATSAGALPNERGTALRKMAFDLLRAKGRVKGTFEEWDQDWKTGGREMINNELNAILTEQAQQSGMSVGGTFVGNTSKQLQSHTIGGMSATTNVLQTDTAQNRQIDPIITAIEAKGGRPIADVIQAKILAELEKQTKLAQAREAKSAGVQPALPPAQAPANMRPNP